MGFVDTSFRPLHHCDAMPVLYSFRPSTLSNDGERRQTAPARSGAGHGDPIELVNDCLEAVDLVLLQRPILARAAEPFPIPLGTLDALHLATALVWRDRMRQELVMATHDGGLAIATRAFGIQVLGS